MKDAIIPVGRCIRLQINTTTATAITESVIILPNMSRLFSKGDAGGFSCDMERAIIPISVSAPTPVTTQSALPDTANVDENAMFRRACIPFFPDSFALVFAQA